jgi:hypothetical protein
VDEPVPVIAVSGADVGISHSVSTMVPPAGMEKLATEVATLAVPRPTKMVFAPELLTTRSLMYPEAVVKTVPAVVVTEATVCHDAAMATRSLFLTERFVEDVRLARRCIQL